MASLFNWLHFWRQFWIGVAYLVLFKRSMQPTLSLWTFDYIRCRITQIHWYSNCVRREQFPLADLVWRTQSAIGYCPIWTKSAADQIRWDTGPDTDWQPSKNNYNSPIGIGLLFLGKYCQNSWRKILVAVEFLEKKKQIEETAINNLKRNKTQS